MILKQIAVILLLAVLHSCQFTKKDEVKDTNNNDKPTIHKTYYEKSGAIKSEITVRNNKKNGPAKKYYLTGELHTLVNYADNIKQGETIWYYKSGKPYRVTPYVNGKMDGIRKVYYENGKLQAEIPYKKGRLLEGTKEYAKNDKRILSKVSIIFAPKDLIKFSNKYILKLTLSNKARKVKFVEEKISTEGTKIFVDIPSYNGEGQIEFFLPPGSFKKSVVKISAEYKSRLGNPILIKASYNLAIENR